MKSDGRNAGRLLKVKRHYDHDNVFSSAIPLPVNDGGRQKRENGHVALNQRYGRPGIEARTPNSRLTLKA